MVVELAALCTALCAWGEENRRVFPWRATDNPFHIMMAELMLRRTQAKQVVGVYTTFIDIYPRAAALMEATEKEIAEAQFSLGLTWRLPAFQLIARVLVERYEGQVLPVMNRWLHCQE
jgi:A/G-specific adenine glycosylase